MLIQPSRRYSSRPISLSTRAFSQRFEESVITSIALRSQPNKARPYLAEDFAQLQAIAPLTFFCVRLRSTATRVGVALFSLSLSISQVLRGVKRPMSPWLLPGDSGELWPSGDRPTF